MWAEVVKTLLFLLNCPLQPFCQGRGVRFEAAGSCGQLAFPHARDEVQLTQGTAQREKSKKGHSFEERAKIQPRPNCSWFQLHNVPALFHQLVLLILLQIVDWAYKHGLASWYPEPADKEAFVKQLVYSPDYDSFVIDNYRWPPAAMQTQDV